MPKDIRGWLSPVLPIQCFPWLSGQGKLQEHFDTQVAAIPNALTRRFFKKMLWRMGKLVWGPSQPDPATGLLKFPAWKLTKRTDAAERLLNMNCWEAVLYMLFQAEGVSIAKLTRYYNLAPTSPPAAPGAAMRWPGNATPADFNAKQVPLFGTGTAWNGLIAGPATGDILTFQANINAMPNPLGMLNHMGIYAGVFNGMHYILHLLSLDQGTTGIGGIGMVHLEPVTTTIGRYAGTGGCQAFYTPPFWVNTSPTHAYFNAI